LGLKKGCEKKQQRNCDEMRMQIPRINPPVNFISTVLEAQMVFGMNETNFFNVLAFYVSIWMRGMEWQLWEFGF
jgi:hypothetical protein